MLQSINIKETVTLAPRGLPGLMSARPTTTQQEETTTVDNTAQESASTTTKDSTKTGSSVTSSGSSLTTSTSLPTLISSTTTTSSSIITPTILPPNASNNPYILGRDSRINGTVFIATGAVLAAILASIWLFLILQGYISRRAYKDVIPQYRSSPSLSTTSSYDEEKEDFGNNEKLYNNDKLVMKGSEQSPRSDEKLTKRPSIISYPSDFLKTSKGLSATQSPRDSLFISPTVEILSLGPNKLGKITSDSSVNASSTTLNSTYQDLTRPTDLFKIRKGSPSPISGSPRSFRHSLPAIPLKVREDLAQTRKRIPSMFLDDLLENHLDNDLKENVL